MSRAVEELNRRMLRARDAIDRAFAQPLDIANLAQVANVSEAHFIRTFRGTFGETPHRYLQRRRVERAMFKLSETERTITGDAKAKSLFDALSNSKKKRLVSPIEAGKAAATRERGIAKALAMLKDGRI